MRPQTNNRSRAGAGAGPEARPRSTAGLTARLLSGLANWAKPGLAARLQSLRVYEEAARRREEADRLVVIRDGEVDLGTDHSGEGPEREERSWFERPDGRPAFQPEGFPFLVAEGEGGAFVCRPVRPVPDLPDRLTVPAALRASLDQDNWHLDGLDLAVTIVLEVMTVWCEVQQPYLHGLAAGHSEAWLARRMFTQTMGVRAVRWGAIELASGTVRKQLSNLVGRSGVLRDQLVFLPGGVACTLGECFDKGKHVIKREGPQPTIATWRRLWQEALEHHPEWGRGNRFCNREILEYAVGRLQNSGYWAPEELKPWRAALADHDAVQRFARWARPGPTGSAAPRSPAARLARVRGARSGGLS